MSIVPSPLRNPLSGLFAKAQPRSVPLAWRNLVANKQRLLRSAAGIGFAVLLMLMQLGFEQAFFDSTLAVIRELDGDILIQSVRAQVSGRGIIGGTDFRDVHFSRRRDITLRHRDFSPDDTDGDFAHCGFRRFAPM